MSRTSLLSNNKYANPIKDNKRNHIYIAPIMIHKLNEVDSNEINLEQKIDLSEFKIKAKDSF